MNNRSIQTGLLLASLALMVHLVLAIAQLGLFGISADMNAAFTPHTASDAVSGMSDRALVAALLEICTEHGLVQRDSVSGKYKGPLLPTCPLCVSIALGAFIFIFGALLVVLPRRVVQRLRPLKAARRPLEMLLQSYARPRAPPSLWMAA